MRLINYNSKQGDFVDECLKNTKLTNLVESYLFCERFIRLELPSTAETKLLNFLETFDTKCVLKYTDMMDIYVFYTEKQACSQVINTFDASIVEQAKELIQNHITNHLTKHNITVLDSMIDLRDQKYSYISILFAVFDQELDTYFIKLRNIDLAKYQFKVQLDHNF